VLEFDSIVVKECPHEAAQRGSEPAVMKFDEGDHVALGQAWLLVLHRWRNPLTLRRRGNRMEKPLSLQVPQPVLHHDQWAPVVGGDELHRHGHNAQ